MAHGLAIVTGLSVAAVMGWVPAPASAQDGAAGSDTPPAAPSIAITALDAQAKTWRAATLDRSLLPAPTQPRLSALGVQRTLDSMSTTLGDLQISLFSLHPRTTSEPRPILGQRRDRRRAWTLASQMGWAVGSGDIASFGVSESIGRINTPFAVASGRTNSQVTTGAFTWQHQQDWTLTLNWQRTAGGSARGARRLAQFAAGAPLSAAGLSLTMATLPRPLLGEHATVLFGGLVSQDKLQRNDMTALNLSSASRAAGRLFMRVGF